MVKKWAAVFLTVLLVSSAACAQEVFIQDAQQLLFSIRPDRDMLTLDIAGEEDILWARLMQEDGITDFSLKAGETDIHVQALPQELYLDMGDNVLRFRYEDFVQPAAELSQLDLETAGRLLNLMAEKLILPHAAVSHENGITLHYYQTMADLIQDLSAFGNAVFADESYDPLLKQLFQLLSRLTGVQLPELSQIKQAWPNICEQFREGAPDVHISLDLNVNDQDQRVDLYGEIGTPDDLYSVSFTLFAREQYLKLNGTLKETISLGETTREYPITVDASYDHGIWALDINYPSQRFTLNAEGSHADGMGRFSVNMFSFASKPQRTLLNGSYTLTSGGLNALVSCTSSYTTTNISLMLAGNTLDITITDNYGQTLLSVKTLFGYDGIPTYASLELLSGRSPAKLVYEGDKAVLFMQDMTVTMTGHFESDHTWVLNMHPEYTQSSIHYPQDAAVRLSYEGEEGNFSVTAHITDVEGKTAGTGRFECRPCQGIPEKLSEAQNMVTVTPESLLLLIAQ